MKDSITEVEEALFIASPKHDKSTSAKQLIDFSIFYLLPVLKSKHKIHFLIGDMGGVLR